MLTKHKAKESLIRNWEHSLGLWNGIQSFWLETEVRQSHRMKSHFRNIRNNLLSALTLKRVGVQNNRKGSKNPFSDCLCLFYYHPCKKWPSKVLTLMLGYSTRRLFEKKYNMFSKISKTLSKMAPKNRTLNPFWKIHKCVPLLAKYDISWFKIQKNDFLDKKVPPKMKITQINPKMVS